MSASIVWLPVNKSENRLHVATPSGFIDAMAKAGLSLPRIITNSDIPILIGMAAVCAEGNPYQQIIDLLEKYEEVEVKAKY